MVANWIFRNNLRPFLCILSGIVGYDFDDDDWTAIEYGLRDTDGDKGRWFTYRFEGAQTASLALALDQGTQVVLVQADTPAPLDTQVALAVSICQSFDLHERFRS